VRVSSPSKDDLQDAMRGTTRSRFGVALQFGNYDNAFQIPNPILQFLTSSPSSLPLDRADFAGSIFLDQVDSRGSSG